MSTAFGNSGCGGRIGGSGGNETTDLLIGDRNLGQRRQGACSDSSSSSIGKNSDISGGLSSDSAAYGAAAATATTTEEEVQSSYKGGGGGALDAMDALEQVLPIRRGISRFYNGKSKSFASLAYASSSSSSSIQDIAKPENAYTRRRRNLLASSLAWDKNRSSPLRNNNNGAAAAVGSGGISKRFTTNLCTKTKLALALAMTNSSEEDLSLSMNLMSRSPSTTIRLPFLDDRKSTLSPHLRRDFCGWRSLSLADLQCATFVANTHHDTSAGSSSTTSSDEHPSPY